MDDPLRLNVALEASEDERFRLHISLAYQGAVSATAYRASLPWESVHSLLLSAIKLDAFGTPIEQVFAIDDPGSEKVTLAPGQVLAGYISLDERFPDLAKAHQERDIIIFWTYQMITIDGMVTDRSSGSVLLERKTTSVIR